MHHSNDFTFSSLVLLAHMDLVFSILPTQSNIQSCNYLVYDAVNFYPFNCYVQHVQLIKMIDTQLKQQGDSRFASKLFYKA